MRGTKMFIGLLVSGAVLYAQPSIQDAKLSMSEGINKIQKGLIDNNKSLIKEGITIISKGNKAFLEKQNLQSYLPKAKQNLVNQVLIISNDLNRNLLEIETNIANKSNEQAQRSYSKILNDCSKCHRLLNKSL